MNASSPLFPYDGADAASLAGGVDVSIIAELAFGGPLRSDDGEARHLALLSRETLELDLSDPEQRRFGDYELLELIGEGGMGVVYRAHQTSLDREVAVKLLAAGPWASAEFIERFRREAQNAARMQHPNIVAIYEVGDSEELHFFSMRLIRGPSLAAELRREKRLSPQRAAQLLRTIAEALDYAHRLGVLHLDLKPANVLIDENGIPHVADFGLARRLDSALAADNDEVSGTPSYMAPEQASPRTRRITRATDIWGLGAILYELVTGEPPFLGATPQDTLKLVVDGTLRAPRRYAPDLPPDLEAIILKCMAREAGERYATARDLADDLTRLLEGRAVSARPLNGVQRAARWARREPRLAAALLAAFAALLVGLAATTQQWRRADRNAQSAQANAATANEHLWDSRDDAALRLMDGGDGWNAAPLLLANVAEMEGAGAGERAAAERRKLGIIERLNPALVDVVDVPGTITALAFNPAGTQLAVASDHAPPTLYDVATGELHPLRTPDAPPQWQYWEQAHLSWSPDGRWLFGATRPGARMIPRQLAPDQFGDVGAGTWSVLDGSQLIDDESGTLSRDARFVVATDAQSRSRVWSLQPRRPLTPQRKLAVNPGLPFVLPLFAPDGRWFAVTHHGELEFVDTATLRETPVQLPADFEIVQAWAISPDSRWLVISDHERHALAIDHASGAVHALAPQPAYPVGWFAFNADGTRLAAASGKGGVYLWQWPLGELVVPPFAGPASADFVDIDGERDRVLVSGSDGSASIWQIAPSAFAVDRLDAVRIGDRIEVPQAVTPVAWHPGSGLLAESLGALRVTRLPPAPLKRLHAAPIKPTTLRFDGRRLAVVDGNRVLIVDAASEAPLLAPVELEQAPAFAQLTADGATLVVVCGRRLHAYDTASGKPRFAPLELTASTLHVEAAPDGRRVVIGWLDHGAERSGELLEARSLDDGRRLGGPVRLPGPLDELRFSASGRRLLAWSFEYASLRDGVTLAAIAGPLQDLRARGFRKRPELGYFALATFDGEDPLLAVAISKGSEAGQDAEIDATELRRFDASGQFRSTPASPKWKAALGRPGSHELLVIPGDDPLALIDADGRRREFDDGADAGAVRGHALATSSDGRWLARSLRDGVELFDGRDGKRLARLHAALAPPDRVWQLAFSPDGGRLLALTLRNRWMVWEIAPDLRPTAAIRRELELRAIGHRDSTTTASAPVTALERAQLRATAPGTAAAPAQASGAPVARRLASGDIPARSADAPANTLDLTALYNRALGDLMPPTMSAPSDYSWLPLGVQRLLGVDYDVRGAILLRSEDGFVEKSQYDAKASVTIPLAGRRASAIDVLMLVNFGIGDPIVAATATLRYADRSRAELPIRADHEVYHWRRQTALEDSARLATLGYDARILPEFWRRVRVYAVHLENPHPGKALQSLGFTAGQYAGASPMIFAVTLQAPAAAGNDEPN